LKKDNTIPPLNISYDYEEMLNELKGDLEEGLITSNETIKIVRGEKLLNSYSPIIDYYYNDNKPKESFEEVQVSKVIEEMEYMDKVIKRI